VAFTQFDSDYQSFQHTSTTVARVKGVPVFLEETVCIPLHDAAINQQCTLATQIEQVSADKKSGAITAGELVRIDVSGADIGKVSTAAKAALNTRCGFAKETVASSATKVNIGFDGRSLYA
jgi:hypothetical protein